MTNPKQAPDAQRPICQEPGCGMAKKALRLLGIPVYWVCSRPAERTFQLLTQVAERDARIAELESALSDLVQVNEAWNSEVQNIIGRPPGWTDGYLDRARTTLKGEPQ